MARVHDFTVLVALDNTGHVRALDRFRQLDWAFQKARIKNFVQEYRGVVVIDSTGVGDPIHNDLARSGLRIIPYRFTNTSKKQLVENLSLMFDKQEITIPSHLTQLKNELMAFTYEILPSGLTRYNAPEGLHDDCVISLALAAWGRKHQPRRPKVRSA